MKMGTLTFPEQRLAATRINGDLYVRVADVQTYLTRLAELSDKAGASRDVSAVLRTTRDTFVDLDMVRHG